MILKACLSLGVESFLIHLQIHDFPVTELHWEVLDVVWSSSDGYHPTAEITFTLWNMEVKIGHIFFYLWAGKDALHGHYLVFDDKTCDELSITEYLALTPRSQGIFLVSLEAIFLL